VDTGENWIKARLPGSCLEKDLIQGTTPGREHCGWTVLKHVLDLALMSSSQSRHRRLVHDTAKS